MGYRLGVDTGGTHTDLVLVDDVSGTVWVDKVPSTPAVPSDGVINGAKQILAKANVPAESLDLMVYGTTVSVNRILQGGSTKTALLTTAGFGDVLEFARAYRFGNIYDTRWKPPTPIVSRDNVREVTERVNFRGDVVTPLDEAEVEAIAVQLGDIESVAVCFLHANQFPGHERAVRDIFQRVRPDISVSLSSDLTASTGEYERASTAAVDAFVKPRLKEHFEYLEEQLREIGITCPIYTMQGNGGVMTLAAAAATPVRVMNSGPVAGVIAGADLCQQLGNLTAVTLDMGGTSTDVAVVNEGRPRETQTGDLHGNPVSQSTIEVDPIGAGGGSVAWVDDGGALRVGPHSAGADPGPACYGKGGTEPTTTDAALVLGYLSPDGLLGGATQLRRDLASEAINRVVAGPLGLSEHEAAYGIVRLAAAASLRAIRRMTVARGFDPRDLAMVSFGGAGGLIGAPLAHELEVSELIVPTNPGNVSARGLLLTDQRHDEMWPLNQLVEEVAAADLLETFISLEERGTAALSEGTSGSDLEHLRSLDLRYLGQAYDLTIEFDGEYHPERLIEAFHQTHEERYGHADRSNPVQVVMARTTTVRRTPKITFAPADAPREGRPEPTYRDAYFGEWYKTPIYTRTELRPDDTFEGPFIVQEQGSTTVGLPGDQCTVLADGSLRIVSEKSSLRTSTSR
ncbi:hydantoinase/oxoprolinase family protein [Microbacterium jejuense]|uniref:Hydantoinase/oxoprolinase family protein n=1 Tax=Microbacterium jejuense TaxID=1263637 RepID=A0ABS7HLY5_9MICO|nr:hydantoinase/oxoprolinase family protein [Microbacterium jejuense]MBW9093069.1 hydantoinase/oxoprolinase family protein [Microbacterium jejuense]